MKRVQTIYAILALVLTAGVAHANSFAYSTFTSAKSTNNTLAINPFFDTVKKESNGKLDWKFYPSGQLLAARATLGGIRDGLADAGFVVPAYSASALPTNVLLGMMVNSGTNPVAVAGALNETILLDCKECQDEYRKNGTLFLAGHVTTPYVPLCNKPVKTLKDLHGLKVKSVGSYSLILQAMGAVPVNIPTDEMSEAMDRGQIDCVLGPIAWLENYQLKDNVKYVLKASFGVARAMGLFVMNKARWDALAPADKQIMLKNLGGVVAHAVDGYVQEDGRAQAAADKAGIVFGQPGQGIVEALKPTPAFTQQIIKRAEKLGVKDPKNVMAIYEKALAKWQKIAATIGNDPGKLADALYTNIYSKIDY